MVHKNIIAKGEIRGNQIQSGFNRCSTVDKLSPSSSSVKPTFSSQQGRLLSGVLKAEDADLLTSSADARCLPPSSFFIYGEEEEVTWT